MNKHYYILKNGEISDSHYYDEPHICVQCGTEIKFNPRKIQKLLSRDISYKLDLEDKALAELHYMGNVFSFGGSKTLENRPSSLSCRDFLKLIR